VLGNPYASKASKVAGVEKVANNEVAVAKYYEWLRQQWLNNGKVKQELLRLARAYKQTGNLTLVCWCKSTPDSTEPCHGDVIRDAIKGIIKKGLV
jgi:hypothetical protein